MSHKTLELGINYCCKFLKFEYCSFTNESKRGRMVNCVDPNQTEQSDLCLHRPICPNT